MIFSLHELWIQLSFPCNTVKHKNQIIKSLLTPHKYWHRHKDFWFHRPIFLFILFIYETLYFLCRNLSPSFSQNKRKPSKIIFESLPTNFTQIFIFHFPTKKNVCWQSFKSRHHKRQPTFCDFIWNPEKISLAIRP